MMRSLAIDGFWGAMLGAESMEGCRAVLHGPGGCRGSASALAADLVTRDYEIREGPFYFTHPRIPCTYLDEEDYINGADYKLTDLLSGIEDAEVVVVVQSPGTSLIGDDLNGAAYRSGFGGTVVIQEENLMSEPGHVGYDESVAGIVRAVCQPSEKARGKVNILGIPIILDGWEDTVSELRGYAEAMGLEATFPGAGCSMEELRGSTGAAVNVTVLPEYCVRTAEAYSRLGVPTIALPAPVGFEDTGKWIESLAEAAGIDPAPALELLRKTSDRASRILRSAMGRGLGLRCATYTMDMDSSASLPLAKWLHGYLAMFPEEIAIRPWWDDGYTDSFRDFLGSIRSGDALVEGLTPKRCDVFFACGQTAMLMEKDGICSVGVDVQPASLHRMRFVGRPFLGAKGAMRMLDEMFEKIERYRRQPYTGTGLHRSHVRKGPRDR